MKFKKIVTPINDLYIIEPTVFGDNRGFFMESYSKKDFQEIGLMMDFVQDNHSKSKKGVLRGLHFQTRFTQGKLVRVTRGSVWDVAVLITSSAMLFWVIPSKQIIQRLEYAISRKTGLIVVMKKKICSSLSDCSLQEPCLRN